MIKRYELITYLRLIKGKIKKDLDKMDLLKRQVAEYCTLKEYLKRMTERKNQLEKAICSTMDEFEITTLELPNGSNLNYKVKETLSLTKEKAKTKKEKE